MSDDDMKARARQAARTHGAESEDFGGLVETLVAFAQSEVQRERERWAKIAAELVDENKKLIDRIGELL